MGSIGSYKYPEHTIDECYSIVRTINEYNISRQELLADKLGHSSKKSGAFTNKLTSLRRYGLIEGRGEIELTNLAKKAANPAPNSNEKEEALGEAVKNVTILDLLYERLNYERPGEDDFWYQLAEEAGVKRSEAKEKSPKLKKLYSSGLKFVKETRNEDKSENNKEKEEIENTKKRATRKEAKKSGIYISVDGNELSLDEADEESIEYAKKFLDLKKE